MQPFPFVYNHFPTDFIVLTGVVAMMNNNRWMFVRSIFLFCSKVKISHINLIQPIRIKFAAGILNVLVVFSLLGSNVLGIVPSFSSAGVENDGTNKTLEAPYVEQAQPGGPGPRPTINRPTPRYGVRSQPDETDSLRPASIGAPTAAKTTEKVRSSSSMFIENVGQFDPRVKFILNRGQGNINFATDTVWITTLEKAENSKLDMVDKMGPILTPSPESNIEKDRRNPRKGLNVGINFVNANPGVVVQGIDRLDTRISYFIGSDPEGWYSDVPAWGGVRYNDLYPGIDLEIRGDAENLSWHFILRDEKRFAEESEKSGKQKEVRLRVDGVKELSGTDQSLSAQTDIGDLLLPSISFEEPDGSQKSRGISPQIMDHDIVVFSLNETSQDLLAPPISMQSSYPLEPSVDVSAQTDEAKAWDSNRKPGLLKYLPSVQNQSNPTGQLFYSTYIGGNAGDGMQSIAINSQGEAYIVGQVSSLDYPTQGGSFGFGGQSDLVVSKLSEDGSQLIYSTFIGGSEADCHWDCKIEVGIDGSAFVTGNTLSANFPTTAGAYDNILNGADVFLLKLNSEGTGLDYSTLFGGGSYDYSHGIALESASAVYITGMTASADLPTTTGVYDNHFDGGQDAFVAKFDTLSSGADSLIYSTYVGGASADQGHGIAVLDGMAYVTGQTLSTDFPNVNAFDATANGSWDSIVFELNADGSNLVYSSYLGGSDNDCELVGDFRDCAIAVDENGAAYVTGATASNDLPTTQAYDPNYHGMGDGYVAKISSDGASLIYLSYLGGYSGDQGIDIAVDSTGSAYLTGVTYSSDFPISNGAYQTVYNGIDSFVTKLSSDGTHLEYSTFLGGSGKDVGYDIAVDSVWSVYVLGRTESTNFPTLNAYDQTYNGNTDGFVTKMGTGVYDSQVHDDATLSGCQPKMGKPDCRESNGSEEHQGYSGDPINTRTGGFEYSSSYFSIPTSAGELLFEIIYSSSATDVFTTTMGYGWTHNHDTRLIFPARPGAPVLFKAHSLNEYLFYDLGGGRYYPEYGAPYDLIRLESDPVTYQITDKYQQSYLFDDSGKLLSWSDSQGHSWAYTYDVDGRLDRITDDSRMRYLGFHYDEEGRIEDVYDYTGRQIGFGYSLDGDLNTILDVQNKTWNLTYDESHHLRLVQDPANSTIVHTEYDEMGRAYQQYDGSGTLVLEIDYQTDQAAVYLNGQQDPQYHVYDGRNTLTTEINPSGGTKSKSYDVNFRPSVISDENSHTTYFKWSPDWENLEQVVDAAGNQSDLVYDSLNNLVSTIDPRDYLTTYVITHKLSTLTICQDDKNGQFRYTSRHER
jgi:YD repeat-containing protein